MKNLETMLSSEDMTWETPQDFFDKLDKEFNFTLDPCATPKTAKCKKYYTKEDDGLLQDWGGETVFCNPPYGTAIKHWVKKCSEESKQKNTIIVMLIPARTDTIYFHEHIYHKTEIRFIKGRLKFNGKQRGSGSAPFPSMLVIFNQLKKGAKENKDLDIECPKNHTKELEEFEKYKCYFLRNDYFREVQDFIRKNYIPRKAVEEIITKQPDLDDIGGCVGYSNGFWEGFNTYCKHLTNLIKEK